MTYQLIYSSRSSTPMQRDDLEDILEQAQVNNESGGITGALVYVDGHFLQILEGERALIEGLMQTISRDLRHENITVLHAGEVAAPAFSHWRMAYVSATPLQVADWLGVGAPDAAGEELWEDLRHDREKVAQLAQGILAVLAGDDPA
jgi:hypothetical protein